MKRKEILLLGVTGISLFVLGFLAHIGYDKICEEPHVEDEIVVADATSETYEVDVRINDGYVEWFDGSKWNREESVEELQAQDPYYLAQTALTEFEESYRAELESENQAAMEEANVVMQEPLVGSEKKTSSSSSGTTSKKEDTSSGNDTQTQTSETTTTTTPAQTVTPSTSTTPSQSTNTSQSTSSTPAETQQPSTPSTPETPTQPETPSTPTVPETPAEPDAGTGDGEDIGWSDDYL